MQMLLRELKVLCSERRLTMSGTKQELKSRLEKDDEGGTIPDSNIEIAPESPREEEQRDIQRQ